MRLVKYRKSWRRTLSQPANPDFFIFKILSFSISLTDPGVCFCPGVKRRYMAHPAAKSTRQCGSSPCRLNPQQPEARCRRAQGFSSPSLTIRGTSEGSNKCSLWFTSAAHHSACMRVQQRPRAIKCGSLWVCFTFFLVCRLASKHLDRCSLTHPWTPLLVL